ncbi:MAG: hypothetical protein KGH53_02170 [Candidatus Micrarchaeota archaeon]|nr:hypothetical protein [Candidatus Micrarchaeota archaeon]
MGTSKIKIQSATEYLLTYGWAFLIAVIVVASLYLFVFAPSTLSPSTCAFTSGVFCQDLILGSSSMLSKMAMLLTNSNPYPIINPRITLNLSGMSSISGTCIPNFVLPGGAIICNATITPTISQGALASGKFIFSYTPCPGGSVSQCQNNARQSYLGSFNTHASPLLSPTTITITLTPQNTSQVALSASLDKLTANVRLLGTPLSGATVNFTSNSVNAPLNPLITTTDGSGNAVSYISSSVSGNVLVTASFANQIANAIISFTPPVCYTISISSLSGASSNAVTVDGVGYSSFPQQLCYGQGTSHSYSFATTVAGAAGIQYLFNFVSGCGATTQSGTLSGVANCTLNGNYITQYFLTTSASPGIGGSLTPVSGWYNAGSGATLGETPSAGYAFNGFTGTGSGSYTGASTSPSVTLNNPITETGAFTSTSTSTTSTTSTSTTSTTSTSSTSSTSTTTSSTTTSTSTTSTIAPVSLDFHVAGYSTSGTVTSPTFTTSNPNDMLVALAFCNAGCGSGPNSFSDTAGLTWTLEYTTLPGACSAEWVYYALPGRAVSNDAVSTTFAGSGGYYDALFVLGVTNGKVFDPNVSLPSVATRSDSGTPDYPGYEVRTTYSTSIPNDLLIGMGSTCHLSSAWQPIWTGLTALDSYPTQAQYADAYSLVYTHQNGANAMVQWSQGGMGIAVIGVASTTTTTSSSNPDCGSYVGDVSYSVPVKLTCNVVASGSITINSGVTVDENGHYMQANKTFTNSGVVTDSFSGGGGGAGSSVAGVSGSAGASRTSKYLNVALSGGAGGGSGGAGGPTADPYSNGAGGWGGSGGAGGGIIEIYAGNIINSGLINASGSNGQKGWDAGASHVIGSFNYAGWGGGGGGGAGGSGGTVLLAYSTALTQGNIAVNAGSGGAGGYYAPTTFYCNNAGGYVGSAAGGVGGSNGGGGGGAGGGADPNVYYGCTWSGSAGYSGYAGACGGHGSTTTSRTAGNGCSGGSTSSSGQIVTRTWP